MAERSSSAMPGRARLGNAGSLSGDRWPYAWLLALLIFRLLFSLVLPLTGDEAYFVVWGENPAGGYYDHPPMVGWWLSGLLALGRAEWVLRLPSTLLPLVLAWGAWWLVRPHGAERARYAALLVLLQPVNVWNVLITTDTPVVLFSMLSLLAYVAALRARAHAWRWHALAGVLLGLAFLGKYFAALLGLAYLAHVVGVRRERTRWRDFAVLVLASLPAPAYNLWWNSDHCWVNILFNFLNRNGDSGFAWSNPALYALSLGYLLTPWLLFALWRGRAQVAAAVRAQVDASAILWLFLVPLLLFAALSLWRSIGLHWLISFTPLGAVLAAYALPGEALRRVLRGSAWLALLHVLLVVVLTVTPMRVWKNNHLYDGIVLTVKTDDVVAELQPYVGDYQLAMESYSPAAILAYHAQRPVAIFGGGSFHARQDDFLTDWRALDQRRVLILVRGANVDRERYARYFEHVEYRSFDKYDMTFSLVLGQGFRYARYRDEVLSQVRDHYYRAPAWLPLRGCQFCARYFPDAGMDGVAGSGQDTAQGSE